MHAVLAYRFPALFSLRMLQANAFTARTLVCPTPASVKLAILSALLRRDGPRTGQEHLDWLAPLDVAWRPPHRLAVSAATVRVWKGDKPTESLEMSVGMREYVHADGEMGLALLGVPDDRSEDVAYGLSHLRALGNAESMIQPLGPPSWVDALPDAFLLLTEEGGTGEFVSLLDDLGTAPSFERLSVYRSVGRHLIPRLGEDRRRLLVRFPFRITRRTADGMVVERES